MCTSIYSYKLIFFTHNLLSILIERSINFHADFENVHSLQAHARVLLALALDTMQLHTNYLDQQMRNCMFIQVSKSIICDRIYENRP